MGLDVVVNEFFAVGFNLKVIDVSEQAEVFKVIGFNDLVFFKRGTFKIFNRLRYNSESKVMVGSFSVNKKFVKIFIIFFAQFLKPPFKKIFNLTVSRKVVN